MYIIFELVVACNSRDLVFNLKRLRFVVSLLLLWDLDALYLVIVDLDLFYRSGAPFALPKREGRLKMVSELRYTVTLGSWVLGLACGLDMFSLERKFLRIC